VAGTLERASFDIVKAMSDFEMLRRDALKVGAGLVAIAGTGMAAPTAPDWKAAILDPHQLATVEALEELIIPTTDTPGAQAALVHRYIDLFLDAASPAERESFLEGLGWLDGYTLKKFEKPFVKLSPAQQVQVLEILDQLQEINIEEGHRFFRQVKSMVARIYYNTKIGYDELNKGGRVPVSYGCKV
jgi:hypothetical protein